MSKKIKATQIPIRYVYACHFSMWAAFDWIFRSISIQLWWYLQLSIEFRLRMWLRLVSWERKYFFFIVTVHSYTRIWNVSIIMVITNKIISASHISYVEYEMIIMIITMAVDSCSYILNIKQSLTLFRNNAASCMQLWKIIISIRHLKAAGAERNEWSI